ncbi:putative metal-dependent hydrolase [Roseovarius sp. MBR-78]|uniref:M48 family metallopeptidase n=1 Tax=Roseovarius sp. MBR-78 TaxID=3156460 RepID=UPI00339896D7
MGQHLLPGNPPVALTLRKSGRARRLSLRVSGLDGQVTLTVPQGVSETEALGFARSRADWLRRTLAAQPSGVTIAPGAMLPIEGELCEVVPGSGRQVRLGRGLVHVPGAEDMLAPRLRAWLRARARDRLAAASDHHAQRLGLGYSRLALRDTRSRWGSCSAQGALSYSWRLILAPPEVLDYVAAHEVAHLAEMNHSPAFWAVVARLLPGYDAPRAWLRREGAGLHRYRFE